MGNRGDLHVEKWVLSGDEQRHVGPAAEVEGLLLLLLLLWASSCAVCQSRRCPWWRGGRCPYLKSGFGLMDRDVFGLMDVLDVLDVLDALEELWENRPCQARAG